MAALHTREWSPHGTDPRARAPVAVLVHGITGWWRTWWRVGPALATRGWRVIGVDLPGHGCSAAIRGTTTREEMSVSLERTIEGLGLVTVDAMVGHSLGAAVVQELVHRRPSLARRVVLEDPPGTDRLDDVTFQEHLAAEVAAARQDPAAERARERAQNPAWLDEDVAQNVEGRAISDIDGIVASLRAGMGSRVPELAAQLTVPALYLVAPEDRSAIRGDERRRLLAGMAPASRAIELDSGHTIHRDRFDDYLAAALAWLDVDGR